LAGEHRDEAIVERLVAVMVVAHENRARSEQCGEECCIEDGTRHLPNGTRNLTECLSVRA
jgi:hypothetical protein